MQEGARIQLSTSSYGSDSISTKNQLLTELPVSTPVVFPSSSDEYTLNIVGFASEYRLLEINSDIIDSLSSYSTSSNSFEDVVPLESPYVTTVNDSEVYLTEKLTCIEEIDEATAQDCLCVDFRSGVNESISRVCFCGDQAYVTSITFKVEEEEATGMCTHIFADEDYSLAILSVCVDKLGTLTTSSSYDCTMSIYSFFDHEGSQYKSSSLPGFSSLYSASSATIPDSSDCTAAAPCVMSFERVDGRSSFTEPHVTYLSCLSDADSDADLQDSLISSIGLTTTSATVISDFFLLSSWSTVGSSGTSLLNPIDIPTPNGLTYARSLSASASTSSTLTAVSVFHERDDNTDSFTLYGSNTNIWSPDAVVLTIDIIAEDDTRLADSSTVIRMYNPSADVFGIGLFSSDYAHLYSFFTIDAISGTINIASRIPIADYSIFIPGMHHRLEYSATPPSLPSSTTEMCSLLHVDSVSISGGIVSTKAFPSVLATTWTEDEYLLPVSDEYYININPIPIGTVLGRKFPIGCEVINVDDEGNDIDISEASVGAEYGKVSCYDNSSDPDNVPDADGFIIEIEMGSIALDDLESTDGIVGILAIHGTWSDASLHSCADVDPIWEIKEEDLQFYGTCELFFDDTDGEETFGVVGPGIIFNLSSLGDFYVAFNLGGSDDEYPDLSDSSSHLSDMYTAPFSIVNKVVFSQTNVVDDLMWTGPTGANDGNGFTSGVYLFGSALEYDSDNSSTSECVLARVPLYKELSSIVHHPGMNVQPWFVQMNSYVVSYVDFKKPLLSAELENGCVDDVDGNCVSLISNVSSFASNHTSYSSYAYSTTYTDETNGTYGIKFILGTIETDPNDSSVEVWVVRDSLIIEAPFNNGSSTFANKYTYNLEKGDVIEENNHVFSFFSSSASNSSPGIVIKINTDGFISVICSRVSEGFTITSGDITLTTFDYMGYTRNLLVSSLDIVLFEIIPVRYSEYYSNNAIVLNFNGCTAAASQESGCKFGVCGNTISGGTCVCSDGYSLDENAVCSLSVGVCSDLMFSSPSIVIDESDTTTTSTTITYQATAGEIDTISMYNPLLDDTSQLLLENDSKVDLLDLHTISHETPLIVMAGQRSRLRIPISSSYSDIASLPTSSFLYLSDVQLETDTQSEFDLLYIPPIGGYTDWDLMIVAATSGISGKMPGTGSSSVDTDHSEHVLIPSTSFGDSSSALNVSLSPPIVVNNGSVVYAREVRTSSVIEQYYDSEIGVELLDDSKTVILSFSFSALMDPDVYDSLGQFVVFYGQPTASFVSACGGIGDTPGIDIEGYWFGLRSELDDSSSSSSDDESTTYGFQLLFFVSLSGAQCSLIALNNDTIPSISVSALSQPTLNGDLLTTENCGFSSPSMSHLVSSARYPSPSAITDSDLSELSVLSLADFEQGGCVHGVWNIDSEDCECSLAYTNDICSYDNCSKVPYAVWFMSQPGFAPYTCQSMYNTVYMKPNVSSTMVVSSSSVIGREDSLAFAVVGEGKRLTLLGGQTDSMFVYVTKGSKIAMVGHRFLSTEYASMGCGVYLHSYAAVETINYKKEWVNVWLIPAASSYTITETTMAEADLPTIETFDLDDPSQKFEISSPISLGGVFVNEFIVTPRGDLCAASVYSTVDGGIDVDNCSIGLLGILNDSTTESIEDAFMDASSEEYSVTKVTLGVEGDALFSVLETFHIQIYGQLGSSTSPDVVVHISISNCGQYEVVIVQSNSSSSTTLTMKKSTTTLASSTFAHDLGTSITFAIVPVTYTLEKDYLTCVNGTVVVDEGTVSCECDDRWTGETCNTCSLAYWGDELGGCRKPNCRGRCDDSRCIALTDDAAVCSCVDDTLEYLINSGSHRSIFSRELALITADDSDEDYLDLVDTHGVDVDICNVTLNPHSILSLNNIGVSGSVIAGSSSTINVTGNVFTLDNSVHIFSKSPIQNTTAKAEISSPASTDLIWESVSADLNESRTFSACLIGEVSAYSANICDVNTDDDSCVEDSWLSFSCDDSYSTKIIDTSVKERGSIIDEAISSLTSFSSSECSDAESDSDCLVELSVWPFPLYSYRIVYLQFSAGQILFLDEDMTYIGAFTLINEEVDAPYDVYFDDLDGDDSVECKCCSHRIIVQTSIETLSFAAEVQVSLYRDGRINVDYFLEEPVDIESKVRPELVVSGRSPPSFSVPDSSLMFDYSSHEGCEDSDSPYVEFSISYIPSQSYSLNLAADECDNVCLFGECSENYNGVNGCECGVRFIGDFCESCAGGWETESNTDINVEQCTIPTCSFFSECNDNGTCSGDELSGVQECLCDSGYVGISCETATPSVECASTCLNGGSCFSGACVCPDGYTGDTCSDLICSDGCSEDVEGGECNSSTGLCECNTNWSGDTCSEYTPDGSCLYGVSNGSGCTCQLNYSGDYCQCKNNCSLHGLCNEWGCECEDGFSGGDCSEARVPEIDTDSIYIDYAEAVIGFSFLYEVTISGINETDVTFDCSLLIEEYGESGSFGATVKYFDSSSI
ncbi:hypothetical protein ADUPG1_013036, partial [Aduncisulcus paluster]